MRWVYLDFGEFFSEKLIEKCNYTRNFLYEIFLENSWMNCLGRFLVNGNSICRIIIVWSLY